MELFLNTIFGFPTIVFTCAVIMFTLYWLCAILGMVELEILDFDLDETALDLTGLMQKIKLDGVPVTIALSLLFYFSWLVSMAIQYQLFHFELNLLANILVGFGVMIISLLLGDVIASQAVRPLRKIFRDQEVLSKKDLVGQVATVRSHSVSQTFGEAIFNDGAAGIQIKIRSYEENHLTKGDQVMLLEYQSQQDTYTVAKH